MHKCLNLSRLPKAKHVTSINLRRTTPGSPLPLLIRSVPYNRKRAVDPSHPATLLQSRDLPCFTCPAFTLRAAPKAALLLSDIDHKDPATRLNIYTHLGEGKGALQLDEAQDTHGRKKIDMNLFSVVSKKNIDKRAVVRHRIITRFKSAIGLILAHGADAVEDTSAHGKNKTKSSARRLTLISTDSKPGKGPSGNDWILADWSYLVVPTLFVYRMPMAELVQYIRAALETISEKAKLLERKWEKTYTLPSAPRLPLPSKDPSPISPLPDRSTPLETPSHTTVINNVPQTIVDFPVPPVSQDSHVATLSTPRPIPRLFFPNMPPPRPSSLSSSKPQNVVVKSQSLLYEKEPIILRQDTNHSSQGDDDGSFRRQAHARERKRCK
ncbi:hypothetical protein SERLA73DRAFT_179438 [Serpula lacrymans var. lacrymans S7.3]|uniref:Uncharacterized protein n=2 Tax=Serpula lacrymans var. lacrymans TaxID=341189 RepID=F8PSF8_SERL3|nr:uncharacterized protein SERLADRAFT_464556 [Serpula lacrymans var. lacrymans S7.9]EGO01288.1 hypothetical protein SERLA73DRAFT_179438 [Serpula lacrymans var. lacrymans S7.3]EGO26928.1 hypothetical protein SERLADRAFT_464556 [Serpula lacrymans var. lacrymans S7.9]